MAKENHSTKASKDFIEMTGRVMELLPAGSFKVKLENGKEILGHCQEKCA
jgi:translation initiation factor IF-1